MTSGRLPLRALFVVALLLALPVVPADAYPAAGVDAFPTSAQVFITPLPGCADSPLTQRTVLNGPTTVQRSGQQRGEDDRGFIETEIVAMDLTGVTPAGPVSVRESPTKKSQGRVTQQEPGLDFPADSFFDVFIELDYAGRTFHNPVPVHMEAVIHSLPPHALSYLPPPGTCVPLAVLGSDVPVLYLIHAEHTPHTDRFCMPAGGTLTVFDPASNQYTNLYTEGPGLVQIVRGLPAPGTNAIDTEMIALDISGFGIDQRGGRHPFSLHEPVRTGSFGTTGLPPTIDSFFDIFYDVSLDGVSVSGSASFGGRLDPATGGQLFLQHPAPLGKWILEGGALYAGPSTRCPDALPWP